MTRLSLLSVLLASLTLCGCGRLLPTGCPAGSITGMIRIGSATFGDGAAIPEVRLRDFSRDGVAISAQEATGQSSSVGGTVSNVRVENGEILCTVACTFATPGKYTFTAEASGAAPQTLGVTIPGRDAGGCGGITTGTPVRLDLRFERR